MSVSNQKGFTLIEILIAIVILSFITIGVVTITENSMLTKDRTSQLNADNLQVETAMSRFEWDFSQIYSPMYFSQPMNFNQLLYGNTANQGGNNGNNNGQTDPNDPNQFGGGNGFGAGATLQSGGSLGGADPSMSQNPALAAYVENLNLRMQTNEHFQNVSKEGLPIPRFYAPDKTTFEFFTSSNRRKVENTKQSHFGWVRYALIPQEDKLEEDVTETKIAEIPKGLKSLVRYFTADDPYLDKRINPDSGATEDKIKASVLLEYVETLEFQFWNLQTRKWETSIKSVQNGESLLHGVRVKLAWYDSQGLKRTTDRIFRTHWPISIPVDTTTPTTGTTQGANSGAQNGNNNNGQDGEDDQ